MRDWSFKTSFMKGLISGRYKMEGRTIKAIGAGKESRGGRNFPLSLLPRKGEKEKVVLSQ